jgi:hypothetical protein
MKKYLAYTALGIVLVVGMVYVAYLGIQPRPIPLIKLSTFQNTVVASNSVLLRLRQNLQDNRILFWGIEPGKPHLTRVLKDFMAMNQDPSTAYPQVIVDAELDRLDSDIKALPGERFEGKDDLPRLEEALRQAEQKQTRVLVILPAPYAATFLSGSWGDQLTAHGIRLISILSVNFPRTREQEKEMSIPCDVADHDLSGTGKLGCQIAQTARLSYRKKFATGELVGLMNQISRNDYLFLMAKEP